MKKFSLRDFNPRIKDSALTESKKKVVDKDDVDFSDYNQHPHLSDRMKNMLGHIKTTDKALFDKIVNMD